MRIFRIFQRCSAWTHRTRCLCLRRKKLKKVEAEDAEDRLEEGVVGEHHIFPLTKPVNSTFPNCQDADEYGKGTFTEIPEWQVPQLVMECSERSGARIYRNTSLILPDAGGDLIAGIVANLPVLLQIRPRWHLGYSMAVDGVSLQVLYRQVAEAGPCLLFIEDSNNCIFGAFLSDGLKPGSLCYGSHECFVFRYPRSAGAWRTEVYGWVGPSQAAAGADAAEEDKLMGPHWANYNEALRKCKAWSVAATPAAVVFGDYTGVVIGFDGPSLFLDQNLLRGVSRPCTSFGAPCLASVGAEFVVRNLEVWHWGREGQAE